MLFRSPTKANWLVPAVVGDTKRLCMLICMTEPATATPEPASTAARVRGTRETSRVREESSDPENRSARPRSAAPVPRETRHARTRAPRTTAGRKISARLW